MIARALRRSAIVALAAVAVFSARIGGFPLHMLGHLLLLAAVAPLAVADLPETRRPGVAGNLMRQPLVASVAEMLVVWVWHTPALHLAARGDALYFAAEQASFLAAGLWLWGSALRGEQGESARTGRLAGVGALLFTSMHMTLLGALLVLAPRAFYGGHVTMAEQQLGGTLMLAIGGAAYLIGGLTLLGGQLREPTQSADTSADGS